MAGIVIYKTRYPELGYAKFGDDWRIIDITENGGVTPSGWAVVGPFYHSKIELLCDLSDYARRTGWGE